MAMEAQLQIRQNAMEMQEYMSDLFDWQKSMKANEVRAARAAQPNVANHPAPTPRGRANSSVGEAPVGLQAPGLLNNKPRARTASGTTISSSIDKKQAQPNSAASHTYSNYSKWDKINVDSMLDSDEDSENKTQPRAAKLQTQSTAYNSVTGVKTDSADKVGADLVAQSTRKLKAPDNSASNGHAALQDARPTSSTIKQHPPVRNAEPQTSDAWKARGNDLFKAGQYTYAKDCYTKSIELDPGSAAAYANRALVELKLSQWAEAEEDCSQALKLDPVYVKALHRRGTARQQLGRHLEAAQDFEDAFRLEPGNKTLLSDRDVAFAAHMKAASIPALQRRDTISITHSTTPQGPAQKQAARESIVDSSKNNTSSLTSGVQPPVHRTSATSSHEQATETPSLSPQEPVSNPTRTSTSGTTPASPTSPSRSLSAVAAAAAQQLSSRSIAQAKPPRTSTEFESMWRSFANDQSVQLSYLQLIEPSQLPSIFKSSLTPQLLTSIISTALTGIKDAHWAVNEAFSFLEGLIKVPRLEMAAMCIGSARRTEISKLWDVALSTETVDDGVSERCRAVRKALKL